MRTRTRAAAVAVILGMLAAPAAAQIFTDMRDHPARRAAERLAAKGVVVRLPDGRLAPDEPLTRLDLAQFMGRIVGIPATGMRAPEFRDVDQIPPSDRAAVMAATTLGTMSARKIEVKKGSVVYTLSTNKASYNPTEEIELTFSISNVGPGRETELMAGDRGRHRIKLTERDGLKPGYEGELYVESRTQQGITRDLVARVRIVDVRADGSTVEIVDAGKVAPKAGLKVFWLPDVWFEYGTTQFHDFVVRDIEGNEVARWSLNRPFQPVDRPLPLAANQTLIYQTRWKQLDQNDQPVKPGRYEMVGVHTTKENQTVVTLGYQRGLMPAFPDNTFRPRQPVTRADLAVFVVRGLGLEAEASRKANETLQLADARDIPAEARPHVVLALERKLMSALPDNTFRPTRTATRGEAVIALNAMMESMGRYDYTVASLREVRGGPPPVVVVEDANKQIRSHRVSVLSAVYRNDAPILLLQLRPGDQLRMLKPTDAGEVIYIEATGR